MDFFAHQDAARRASRRLLWVMALAVAAVVVAVNLVFFAAFGIGQRYEPGLFGPEGPLPSSNWDIVAWVSLGTLAVIGGGALMSWFGLRGGGRSVAESLGGREVPHATRDADERRLLNIVEEMAIASGVPMPPVFVIDDSGINAFAAGHRPDDAAIGVTRGLLRLPRDEVQGVIAHEYSHILNGDMRLNMRLISAVAGLLAVASVGRLIVDAALRAPRTSSRKKGGSPLPLIAFGAALFAIGMIGWFLGRVVQAAFSRRREFLADASAVQFTRNPGGIAGALRRIADGGSGVTAARAGDVAHLFFADAILSRMVGMFHTHPPLAERIARIEGVRLDPAPGASAGAAVGSAAAAGAMGFAGAPAARVAPAQVVELAGAMSPERLHLGAALVQRLPAPLAEACREPVTARAVSLLPLLHKDAAQRDAQVARIHARDPWLAAEVRRLHAPWSAIEADRARWPLLQLAAPALAALSTRQRHEHLATARALASDDGVMTLREFTVLRQLERAIGPARPASPRTRLRERRADCAVLLGALALAGGGDAAAQAQSYAAGWARLPMPGGAPARPDAPACGPGALSAALDNLGGLDAAGMRAVIDACAHAVAADGTVSAREAELLRLVAADLGVPIPAFPDG
jgi:Zn-dependent protease with chaperone function